MLCSGLTPLVLVLLFAGPGCSSDSGQERATSLVQEETTDVGYDSLLAAKLNADEYGMRRYVLALLKTGPNVNQDSSAARRLQQAHMENIRRLAKEGKLVLAGPFLDDGPLRGIYVFNVETVEEARELTLTDPAIQAGRLEMELHPWYGSAALKEVNELTTRITKESF